MIMEYSKALQKIPPYPFVEISRKKTALKKKGVDIIDLGIGDPDLPTPKGIVDAMKAAVEEEKYHRYPADQGSIEFREAWAGWCKNRFGIQLDPETQVQTVMGSKEGLCNLIRAFVNPGDKVLVPDPGYPGYKNGGTILTGGIPVEMPLLEENGYLPELEKVDAKGAKLMFLNYPNNPTGAVADKSFYKEAVDFAIDNDIVLCSDNAYSEIYFGGYKPFSVFEVEGAYDCAIEIHSFSKTYNMTGWRLGAAYGNEKIVAGLSKVKSNIDSGCFEAVQKAGIYGLENYDEAPALEEYEKRMDTIISAFKEAGFDVKKPKATFYVWARVPEGETSESFVTKVMERTGVVITPGTAFGKYGEGYFRVSITSSTERIKEAAERIKKLG